MAILLTLMIYGAFSFMASAFNILLMGRIGKHLHIAFYYLGLGQEFVGIAFFLLGLLLGSLTFLGLSNKAKRTIGYIFYGFAAVLGASNIAVVLGMEGVLQQRPREFIDNTNLFRMVYWGYNIAKWGMAFSFAVSLEEIFERQEIPPRPKLYYEGYEPVPASQMKPIYPMQPIQTTQSMPFEPMKRVWNSPYPTLSEMTPLYNLQ